MALIGRHLLTRGAYGEDCGGNFRAGFGKESFVVFNVLSWVKATAAVVQVHWPNANRFADANVSQFAALAYA